ncbi:serine peptidase Clan SC Family S9D [Leishmania donovani]|uniref:Alpha/beta hydrolase family protein n=1 Tax=Leishmania donovani TaxID=5661 RepID=A0A3S7X6G6_LEIDO|nr:serine peptidase, putative [Leishmania donovani]AYU82008.1 serine peptidase, Clan SC, Family S9D [Leishmania donovani]TPP53824.1 Alpha/beta hydrolase family protein [Leishmania donovani]TPP55648.1 Alpha/beta hydrolase family protein [Leishmania donovani]CAJ1992005.1 serine peptidase Clan SC Family S9D [Leishmania donovani]CBZ37182.1 serine peptidase, putative [Leishmania donovani]
MLQSLVNSIVFAPPRDPNSLQRVQLLQRKRHMSFTSKKSGERISYFHFDSKGDLVTKDNLERVVRSSMVLLFHHGNAEDLGGAFSYAQSMACVFGVAVVVYDYCGYGFSGFPDAATPAEVTEKSVYSDADHMYAHLLSLGYPAHRIIIVGRSVGGGPACYLAEKHHKKVGGLVLISTFTSCLRVVSSCCLPHFCCCVDLFPNYRRIEHIMECPVLMMHGTRDNVVPHHCSSELLEDIVARRNSALQRLLKKREGARAKQAKRSSKLGAASTGPTNTTKASAAISVADEALATAQPPPDGEKASVFDLYRRAYDGLPEAVRRVAEERLDVTAANVSIGAFHRWFAGCGHNDIEAREGHTFSDMFEYFVRFATAFSMEREALLSAKPLTGAAKASRDAFNRADSEIRE